MWFFNKISPEVRALTDDMIKNPHDWSRGEYKMVHKKTKVAIWIANGVSSIRFYGGKPEEFTKKETQLIFDTIRSSTIHKILQKENSDG